MSQEQGDWLLDGATKAEQSVTKDWQVIDQPLIDGVQLKQTRPVLTGYGHLTEIIRSEWLGSCVQIDQIFVSNIQPGAISAWHAHAETTDRLFVASGQLRVVLYDGRKDSPSYGRLNEFLVGAQRPMLIIVPPRVWHGVQNYCSGEALLINAVDRAYSYDDPDHWRIAHGTETIPYQFPSQHQS